MIVEREWPLVGRDDELAKFRRVLADPNARGLLVAGAGGLGKTRIAAEFATMATDAGYPRRRGVGAPVLQRSALRSGRLPAARRRVRHHSCGPRRAVAAASRRAGLTVRWRTNRCSCSMTRICSTTRRRRWRTRWRWPIRLSSWPRSAPGRPHPSPSSLCGRTGCWSATTSSACPSTRSAISWAPCSAGRSIPR